MGLIENTPRPTGSSPSALPDSQYTAFESSVSPGAIPSISEPNLESWTILSPPEPFPGTSLQLEELAKHSTDMKRTSTNSAYQTPSIPLLPTGSMQLSHSNTSMASPIPPDFTGSAVHLALHSEETETSSKQQDVASEKTLPLMALKPGQPLEPTKLTFSESLAAESYRQVVDLNQVSPSQLPLVESKDDVGVINMPSNPDEFHFLEYNVPFVTLHPTSPLPEPTEMSLEDFYPTNTVEVDWGSGDYLETMSFFNSDGNDYSMVTKVPYDTYDLEDYVESYDTSFPSRVGISLSSLQPLHVSPSPSIMTTYSTIVPHKSLHLYSFHSTPQFTLEPTPTPNTDIPDVASIEWADTFTIQPTDVLLPDMNSLEYYTTQLTKENNGSETGGEHSVTISPVNATEIQPTTDFTSDANLTEDEASGDLSGLQPYDESTTADTSQLISASDPFLYPSIVPSHFFDSSSSLWGGKVTTTDWSANTLTISMDSAVLTEAVQPSTTRSLPEDFISSTSLTDVHWFVTETFPESTTYTTPDLTATLNFSLVPTEPPASNTAGTTEMSSQDPVSTTEQTLNMTLVSDDFTSHNVTLVPPVMLGDQGITDNGSSTLATMTLIPTTSDINKVSAAPTSTTEMTTFNQTTSGTTVPTEASTNVNTISTTTEKTTATPTSRQYLCDLDRPSYLIKIG